MSNSSGLWASIFHKLCYSANYMASLLLFTWLPFRPSAACSRKDHVLSQAPSLAFRRHPKSLWMNHYPVNFINPHGIEMVLIVLPFHFEWGCLLFLWPQGLLSWASTCMCHAFIELYLLGWQTANRGPFLPGMWNGQLRTEWVSAHTLSLPGTFGPYTLCMGHTACFSANCCLGSWRNH